jgi:arylsulfatase A-like enzyme
MRRSDIPAATTIPLLLLALCGCSRSRDESAAEPEARGALLRTFGDLEAWQLSGTPRSPLSAEVREALAAPCVLLKEAPIPETSWELAPGDPRHEGLRLLFHQPRHAKEIATRIETEAQSGAIPESGAELELPDRMLAPAAVGAPEPWTYLFAPQGVCLLYPESEPGAPVDARVTYWVPSDLVLREVRSFLREAGEPLEREALELGSVRRHGIRLTPGLSLARSLEVPPTGGELVLAFGAEARGWEAEGEVLVETSGTSDGVGLRVFVEHAGEEQLAHETFHAPERFGSWESLRIDLEPWSGRSVRVRLEPLPSADGGDDVLEDFALLAEPLFVPHVPEAEHAPGIVLIVVDTLRADALSCYGAPREVSPAIDALARSGVRFEEVRSTSSWTLPAHASLFTASMTTEHGTNAWTDRLPRDRTTLAEVFRDAGYRTAAFTEGVYLTPSYGMDQGFDSFDHGSRSVRETIDKGRAWLEEVRGPFFLFLHTYEVHSPHSPPEPFRARFVRDYDGPLPAVPPYTDRLDELLGRAPEERDVRYLRDLYAAEIAYADSVLGELFHDLEERKFFERGLLALTSDHGEEFYEHGGFAHRTTLYEEQVRIPLIFRGTWAEGRLDRARTRPARIVDVAPTLLEAADLPQPAEWSGISLSAHAAERPQLLSLIALDLEHRLCRLDGPKKWIGPAPDADAEVLARSRIELYDLERDPAEQRDLFAAELRSAFLERMRELLARFAPLRRGSAEELDLSSEERNRLRAMGYLGGEGR